MSDLRQPALREGPNEPAVGAEWGPLGHKNGGPRWGPTGPPLGGLTQGPPKAWVKGPSELGDMLTGYWQSV
jgi:hypothetical protein